MSTTKSFKDYVVSELSRLGDILCRPMMGEYLLYLNGQLFGGIYDNRVLIKKTAGNAVFNLPEVVPYPGAKPMYYLEEIENTDLTQQVINNACCELKK